jgi:hypothetical protein
MMDERAKEQSANAPEPGDGPDATRRRGARARENSAKGKASEDRLPYPESDDPGLVDLWVDNGKATAQRLAAWFGRSSGLGREHPADFYDLFLYWTRAPMAGSFTPLRWVQRIDGFVIGLPLTLVGYAFAWLGQRPLRRFTAAVIALIIWRLS